MLEIIFWISVFIIFWAMIGYGYSLKFLEKIFHKRTLKKDYTYKPRVSVMIVAHNEEKVIQEKLENIIDNDYPKDKIKYIIASDFSTDDTNNIVNRFINEHPELKMQLVCAKEHKGKTNAQNEAQKFTTGEILVMSDANAMFEQNAISELVACFTGEDIAYVAGRLTYNNAQENHTAAAESTYWNSDLRKRQTESNIQTITAGNGAIYACRNDEYYDFDPIECHDSSMPVYFARNGKRALYNPDAVAYEKAGEIDSDEFKRKIRSNRIILKWLLYGLKTLNVFKYKWFSFFYFGHRTCRYLLWLAHTIALILSAVLMMEHWIYMAAFAVQTVFCLAAVLGKVMKSKNRVFKLASYYSMTVLAQWVAVVRYITGKAKPTWDKAESTR